MTAHRYKQTVFCIILLISGLCPPPCLLRAESAGTDTATEAGALKPDSLYLQLLHALEGKRLKVRLKDGGSQSGVYTETDSGLVLSETYFKNGLTKKTQRVDFIPWRQVESIELYHHDTPWPWIYFGAVVGAALLIVRLCIPTS